MTRARLITPWSALVLLVAVLYFLIFLPLLITAAVSFNGTARSQFPPQGFSVQWWVDAFSARWAWPLWFSIKQSFASALLAVALGVPLALAIHRSDFLGRKWLLVLSSGPLVLPSLVTGIALLQFLNLVGLKGIVGLPALVLGYGALCLPFAVRTTLISLRGVAPSVDLAALSLGASPPQVFRHVTLPLIRDGIVAGGVFSFIQSFTDYSLGLFLSTANDRPLPIVILNYIEFGFTPTIAAVAVMSMIVPVLLIYFVQRIFNVGEFLYGDKDND